MIEDTTWLVEKLLWLNVKMVKYDKLMSVTSQVGTALSVTVLVT